jgi:hypothetical protein
MVNIGKAVGALQESVRSILGCDEDDAVKRAALGESFNQFATYMERNGVMAKSVAGDDIAKADRSGPHSLAAALLDHLHDALDRKRQRHGFEKTATKEFNMRTGESLETILKDSTPTAVCKAIVARDRSPCGEHELVAALTKRASELRPELRPDVAFAKLFESEEAVRRACQVAKSIPIQADVVPLVVGGFSAQNAAMDDTEKSEAYAQLLQIGKDRWPSESEAKAFTMAISDPANAELTNRALRRPTAPLGGAYPLPR